MVPRGANRGGRTDVRKRMLSVNGADAGRRARGLDQRRAGDAARLQNLSDDEVRRLVEDLWSHQTELETQNQELRRAHEDLAQSRNRYWELYDLAPVGYATVSPEGLFLEANLTLADMLGVARQDLVGKPITAFIVPSSQDDFYKHRRRILKWKKQDAVQLRLLRTGAEPFWAELDSSPVGIGDESGLRLRIVISDVTRRRQLEDVLSFQASHDDLTGLVNRREFERRTERALETARQGRGQHVLCYGDLDQFKIVNDTCGHMAGDELLRQVARLMSDTVRRRDTLARLGGDEFGLLLEHCTLQQGSRVAENVRRVISDSSFVWEDQVFSIGVSIGLVTITEESKSMSALLSAADSACYTAKQQGRNRLHAYQVDDTGVVQRHGEARWVARLNQALEEDRFELWSQPIVAVESGSHEGEHFELLLRLVDEEGAIILPGSFLPAAERFGLSRKIDRWVIGTAFNWLNRNPMLMKRLRLCSINLSGASLADEGFLAYVQDQLNTLGMPLDRICFEVTETAAIANLSRALTFLRELGARGCRFALDDFGSGLSSFAYLKTLPVDFLKIDGAFIKSAMDSEVGLALVRSINDVGKVMGKITVAECVESDEIMKAIREIGVDFAQGYWIGAPARIEDVG